MKVFAISGHAQNGKDTVAGMMLENLENNGNKVAVIHYADLVKHICRTYFDWDGKKDERGRHILQYVGTDVVRAKSPNFWVNFVLDILRLFPDAWDYVIIPDTRFPNEIDALRENGFDVTHMRVVRPNFDSPLTPEQQKHPSETALDNVVPDVVVMNGGTLEDLNTWIANYMEEYVYGN